MSTVGDTVYIIGNNDAEWLEVYYDVGDCSFRQWVTVTTHSSYVFAVNTMYDIVNSLHGRGVYAFPEVSHGKIWVNIKDDAFSTWLRLKFSGTVSTGETIRKSMVTRNNKEAELARKLGMKVRTPFEYMVSGRVKENEG